MNLDPTIGMAETALGVTGSETPATHPRDTELGELARPFAAEWFPDIPASGGVIHPTALRERCVGAIRDFVLSGTFKQWREHRPAADLPPERFRVGDEPTGFRLCSMTNAVYRGWHYSLASKMASWWVRGGEA